MLVAATGLAVHVEAMRHDQGQLILRPRHRHVEQAPLLLDVVGVAGRHVRGNAAIDDVEDEHRLPFLALGGMDGRQDQVVLIEQRLAGLVRGRAWRIERQVGEEPRARWIAGRDALQLIEIAGPHDRIRITLLQMRLVPLPHQVELRRPIGGLAAQLRHQLDEVAPGRGRLGGWREGSECIAGRAPCHAIEDLAGRGRTDAVQHLHDAEARDPVGRVLRPAQHSQHILDVGRLDELETAELDEGNVAAGQLDFQHGAVVRRAEQDRLLLERGAILAIAQHGLDDEVHLADVIGDRHQRRLGIGGAARAQVLREAFARQADDGIGGGEDGLRRAIVLLQRDHGRRLE